jgi:cyclic pyranopterin phosphate synthase
MYEDTPILQHRETLRSIEAGEGLRCGPLHVRIEPTEACNFKCGFCYFHDEGKRAELPFMEFTGRHSLELDRLLSLIDELAELGTRAVSFTGAGEPLVFPRMELVLNRIRQRGMRFAVTSNLAMKMSESLVESLAGGAWLRWSLNAGTAGTFRRIHNPRGSDAEGAFQRAQENVRRIDAARKRLELPLSFNASYVVTEINQEDVLPAARLAREMGVDSLSFRPELPFDRQDDFLQYSQAIERDIEKAKSELESETFRIHMNVERLEDVQKLGDPELVCFYSNHTTYVAANGDVFPCCYTRMDRHYAMGNILKTSFKELWVSEERRKNYQALVFDRCPSCPYGRTNQALRALYRGERKADELWIEVPQPNLFV